MNAMKLRSYLIGVSAIVLAPFSYGQVPIDESVGLIPQEVEEVPAPQGGGELFLTLQRLQQEVQMLRGQVEEQAEMIRRLEQQRFDDYVAIDQRLAAIESGDSTVAEVQEQRDDLPVDSSQGLGSTLAQSANVDEEAAKADYDQALTKLRERNFTESEALFKDFILNYPTSRYTANAYYWRGEIAVRADELEQARQHFRSVISFFPDHPKAQDANYKLGVIYWQLGQKEKSREHFIAAAQGTGNSARLAQAKLEEFF